MMNIKRAVSFLAFIVITYLFPIQYSFAQTGDGIINGWLSPFSIKAGNNEEPTYLSPIVEYENGWDKCNSGLAESWEQNCPSDLLYTPNYNTGGYQAFGVGANYFEEGVYYYPVCYWYYYYDSNLDMWVADISCVYYVVELDDHMFGAAAARFRFGNDMYTTPWGAKPLSTLAFNANLTYLPIYSSLDCDPGFPLFGGDSECDGSNENVYAVGGGVGYEDKVVIEDNGCFVSRTGGPSDADFNCFTHAEMPWYSTIPGGYIDTTASDFGSPYIPGMGTQIILDEGTTYEWWTNFYQWGGESGSHEMHHNAAITRYWDLPDGFNCTENPEMCMFNVDQTSISPVEYVP